MGRYLSVPQWLRWTLSYPIEEQGHSASQWLRGSSSFPIVASSDSLMDPLIGPVIASLLERGTMAIRLMNRLGAQGYWMGDGRIWRPNE